MTKNEAATLETVATMGWERFTIRMPGGARSHTRPTASPTATRRGTAYSGLLEKCPCSLPGLEQRAMVWLDEDPTIRTGFLMFLHFHQVFTRNPGKV